MPKPAMRIDMKVETRRLEARMRELARYQQKPLWEVVESGVEMFTQSAVKETPPRAGALKKRKVITFGGNEGRKRTRYAVPFRTNKSKGLKWFGKRTEANRFSKITHRFIGKYGWKLAGEAAIRKPVRVKMRKIHDDVKRKASMIHAVRVIRGKRPFATLINQVDAISRYGRYAIASSLRKTNRRMQAALGSYKKAIRRKDRGF